jgi:hypothetical protein
MATSIGSSLSKLCPDSQTQSSLANIFKIFITVSIKSLTNADNSQGSYQYSNCIKDLETCSTQLQGPTTLQVLQNTLNVFKTVGSFVQGVLQINTASTNQMGDLEALMTSYFDLLYNAPPQSGLPNALITLSNSLGNALQSGICRLYPVPENCLSDLNDFIYYIQNVNTPNNTMNSYLNSVLVQTYVQDLYNVE